MVWWAARSATRSSWPATWLTKFPTTLVTFGPDDRQDTIERLRVRVLGRPWLVRGQRTNPFSWALVGAIRRADVVHCHQQHVVMSSVAAAVCRMTRPAGVRERSRRRRLGRVGVRVDRPLVPRAPALERVQPARRRATRTKPWARVISGGVDAEKFSPDETVQRSRTPIFVGRILPHKGVHDLVDALPPGMPLTIIGPPNDTGTIEALRARAADKPVTFRHDCDDRRLVEEYRRALCVSCCRACTEPPTACETRVPELLGQTLLEAMACGTPVICTNVASLPEIVEDGVSGFVVPPHDPATLGRRLQWLADHPGEAAAMGAAGRRRVVERFQWAHVVRRCLDAYAGS